MDLTAATRTLAEAVGAAARLLPSATLNPVLSGLLPDADAGGLTLAGNDRAARGDPALPVSRE
jgi:DNA polymerase III sliding clamp (beta) subunit (PCNA family)